MAIDVTKYYRKKPIKDFDVNKTMYSMITEESAGCLNLQATSFLGGKMTYGELISESDKLAKSFYDCGVRAGDSVAIMTISMPIVQESLLALSKLGATMVFIDLRAKEKDLVGYINGNNCKIAIVFDGILDKVERIIDETDLSTVVVCSPKDYMSPVLKVLSSLKDKDNIVIPNSKKFVKISDFINNGCNSSVLSAVSFDRERPSIIVQSSGSTGKPKQIVHTEYNFNKEVEKMAYTDLPFYKGDTMHISIPPFIIYGLCNSIYGSMAFSMNALMTPYVDEKTVYDDLGSFDIALAAPLHYRYIYNKIVDLQLEIQLLENGHCNKELKDKYKELKKIMSALKRVRTFVSGGDKISAEELLEMQRLFDTTIVNGYGNNESCGAAVTSPVYANRMGSIGIPMYGTTVKIVDPETEEEVKNGETGELYISSDNLFECYLNNKEETNKIKCVDSLQNKWIRTGDLGYQDVDGYLYIVGRSRRLIKKEAFKISPDTIEDVILSLGFVKECVVVGVDDDKSLCVPMAFIELCDSYNFDDVIDLIKKKCVIELPDYEVPSYFEEIDKMPYTPNGKHDFKLLEKMGNELVKSAISKKLVLKGE